MKQMVEKERSPPDSDRVSLEAFFVPCSTLTCERFSSSKEKPVIMDCQRERVPEENETSPNFEFSKQPFLNNNWQVVLLADYAL